MSSDCSSSVPPTDPALEKLRRLPDSAAHDYRLFREGGNEAALARLILAVLRDRVPDKASGLQEWSDALRLVDDLGFDSLAVAESVFFLEDLFGLSISNAEISRVSTLGELRAFVRSKVPAA